MKQPLSNQVHAAIIAQWQRGERLIDSEDIYALLVKQGIVLPDGAMSEAMNDLVDRGLIYVSHYPDWTGTKRHGAVVITLLKQRN